SVLLYFSFFCLFVLLLPCLLLSRYADPPYLPSFPPRRSSDLLLALAAGALAAGCVRVHVHGDPDHAMTLLLRVATYNASLYDDEDRKSTRLNSSHVKISYAVFCLKKKTIY